MAWSRTRSVICLGRRVHEMRVGVVDRIRETEAARHLQRHDPVKRGTEQPDRVDERRPLKPVSIQRCRDHVYRVRRRVGVLGIAGAGARSLAALWPGCARA